MNKVLSATHAAQDDFFAKFCSHPRSRVCAVIATKPTILCDEHGKQTTASLAIELIGHYSACIPILSNRMANPFYCHTIFFLDRKKPPYNH